MRENQFVKWDNGFSVGNENLDSQHFKIVNLLNDLYISIQEKDPSTINTVLSELKKYTKTHFVEEEDLMIKCNYPEYKVQRKAHLELLQKTSEFISQKQHISGDISFDVFQFLKRWWTDHILKMDLKYKPYLRDYKY